LSGCFNPRAPRGARQSVCAEIVELEKNIAKEVKRENEIVGDTYKDYRTGHGVVKPIWGYPESHTFKKSVLRKQLEQNKKMCEAIKAEIEKFLATVTDSQIRRIIRLKYIEKATWHETAKQVKGKRYVLSDDDALKQQIHRYLSEEEKR